VWAERLREPADAICHLLPCPAVRARIVEEAGLLRPVELMQGDQRAHGMVGHREEVPAAWVWLRGGWRSKVGCPFETLRSAHRALQRVGGGPCNTGPGITRIPKRPHRFRTQVRTQPQRCYRRQLTQLTFPQVTAIPFGGVDPHPRFHEPWSTQPARQRPLTGISPGQGPFLQRGG